MLEFLKFVHVAFAAFWVGGAVLLTVYGMTLMKADATTKIAFSKMTLVAGRLFAGFAAVALIAGLWMVIGYSEIYGIEKPWISIGFVGIFVGAALGPAFYAPQARALIGELEAGDAAAAARERRIGLVSVLETLLLIVVIMAMVYKWGGWA
jgi:uncharacterized membrane protein